MRLTLAMTTPRIQRIVHNQAVLEHFVVVLENFRQPQ